MYCGRFLIVLGSILDTDQEITRAVANLKPVPLHPVKRSKIGVKFEKIEMDSGGSSVRKSIS